MVGRCRVRDRQSTPEPKAGHDVTLAGPQPHLETDAFLADVSYDDVVVGAGLTGLVTACLLARAGHRVAVLEARHIGAVTTGNTTAKLSLLQGTTLSKIIRNHSERVAAAYIEGNREALAWTLRYCEDSNVPIERRDAYTYAGKQSGASAVQKEFEAAQRLGLEVERVDADELPYSTYGAVRLPLPGAVRPAGHAHRPGRGAAQPRRRPGGGRTR